MNIVYSILGENFGFNIYGDHQWYIDAGESLLTGNFEPNFLLYSPFFSIISFILNEIAGFLPASLSFLPQFLVRFFFTISLGFLIYAFAYTLINIRILIPRQALFLCLLILSNPYFVRYSSGFYSDSYYLALGIIIPLKILADLPGSFTGESFISLCGILPTNRQAEASCLAWFTTLKLILLRFCQILDSFSCSCLSYLKKFFGLPPFVFLILIIGFSFFRYTAIVILPSYCFAADVYGVRTSLYRFFRYLISLMSSSLTQFLPRYFHTPSRLLNVNTTLILSLVLVPLAILFAFVYGLSFPSGEITGFSPCRTFGSLLLLLGFREGFWAAGGVGDTVVATNSCFLLNLSPSNFEVGFSSYGLIGTGFNYYVSLLIGFLTVTVVLLGMLGLKLYTVPRLFDYTFFVFFLVAVVVAIIGVGHFRYILPLLPLFSLGFVMLLGTKWPELFVSSSNSR